MTMAIIIVVVVIFTIIIIIMIIFIICIIISIRPGGVIFNNVAVSVPTVAVAIFVVFLVVIIVATATVAAVVGVALLPYVALQAIQTCPASVEVRQILASHRPKSASMAEISLIGLIGRASVEVRTHRPKSPSQSMRRNRRVPVLPACLAPPTTQGSSCIGKHGTSPPSSAQASNLVGELAASKPVAGDGKHLGLVGVRNCTMTVTGFAD